MEGQWQVDQYYACCWWTNEINRHIPGQEVQEKIFQDERKDCG